MDLILGRDLDWRYRGMMSFLYFLQNFSWFLYIFPWYHVNYGCSPSDIGDENGQWEKYGTERV